MGIIPEPHRFVVIKRMNVKHLAQGSEHSKSSLNNIYYYPLFFSLSSIRPCLILDISYRLFSLYLHVQILLCFASLFCCSSLFSLIPFLRGIAQLRTSVHVLLKFSQQSDAVLTDNIHHFTERQRG